MRRYPEPIAWTVDDTNRLSSSTILRMDLDPFERGESCYFYILPAFFPSAAMTSPLTHQRRP